jgi:hypothetical protein
MTALEALWSTPGHLNPVDIRMGTHGRPVQLFAAAMRSFSDTCTTFSAAHIGGRHSSKRTAVSAALQKLGAKQYAADGQQDRQATSDRGSRDRRHQWIWREPEELKVTGGLPGDVGDKRCGSRSRVDRIRRKRRWWVTAHWVTARIEEPPSSTSAEIAKAPIGPIRVAAPVLGLSV